MGGCYSATRTQIQKICLSCCLPIEDKSQAGEPTERTTLLGNPVSNNHLNRPLYGGDAYPTEVSGVPSNVVLPDEQEALKRILQQTASDIIDVSAIPAHLEPKEYLDRVKIYQQKIDEYPYQPMLLKQKPLLKDLSAPDKALAENTLSFADIKMLEDIFGNMYRAFQDIQVHPHADLVAQFGS